MKKILLIALVLLSMTATARAEWVKPYTRGVGINAKPVKGYYRTRGLGDFDRNLNRNRTGGL